MLNTKNILIILSTLFLFSCGNQTTTKDDKSVLVEEEKIDTSLYLQKGSEIAKATFKVLSTNLQTAMANGGVNEAINFCSVNAQPLTDSLSNYHNVTIKRTSNKIRNPLNAPTDQESIMLDKYIAGNNKAMIHENEDGSISFYSPIYTKGLCVVCHGQVGNTIAEADYKTILEKYPEDKAIDYSVDELRGMWSLIFKNKNDE